MKNKFCMLFSDAAKAVSPYQWEKGNLKKYLRFDTNTLPYPPDGLEEFWNEMKRKCPLNEYGDPSYGNLKKLIAGYEGVDPAMISVTNSGDEAIDVLGKTFLDPDDYFMTTPPTYDMYEIQCSINKGVCIEIPLNSGDYSVDEEMIIDTAVRKRVKIVFLCNPNNPTATVIPQEKIERILKETDSIVVVDEVYREFYGETSLPLLKKYRNLVILRSFSKFAALAGARVGYLIADKALISEFEGIRFPMGVSFLSYKMAEFILERKKDWIREQIALIISEREKMRLQLENLGLLVYPSKANFLLVKIGPRAKTICRKLKEMKVLVRDRSSKKYLEGCVRITVRSRKENTQLLNILKENL